MKSNFMKAFAMASLGLTLLLGLSMTPGNTAQAQYQNDQYRRSQDRDRDRQDRNRDRNGDRRDRGDRGRGRNWDGYPNWGGSFQLRQTALNAGYNEGIKQGRDDVRRNRRFDFQRQGAYQKATKDYNSRDGDRELYRRYYREAYENGYKGGFNGN
jgi:hypothetical protein